MELVLTIVVCAVVFGGVGIIAGWRLHDRSYGGWLVRPHTEVSAARMPLPEATDGTEGSGFVVAEGRFVDQGLPGGGSRME